MTHLSDVDPSSEFPSCMPGAEFSDSGDGIEAGVLSQGEGNHLQGLSEGTETVLFHARQAMGMGCQAQRQLCLRGATACYQCPANHTVNLVKAMEIAEMLLLTQ